MKKSLLLISVWFILFCGYCTNQQNENNNSAPLTAQDSTKQTPIKDTVSAKSIGTGNSEVKDTSQKSVRKLYPVPGGPDERKLDSIKRANAKNKK
ncbi:MAG TPA: hypothetical protein VI757_03870 [Bacteroidia bacterium]|nr:hypothetical protein [Bacteroidia bacterium]